MLSDNNSGIFWMLIGLVILVMTGVGFSLLIDSRFKFSSNTKNAEHAIRADGERMTTLLELKERRQAAYDGCVGTRRQDERELRELTTTIASQTPRIAQLKEAIFNTQASTETLKETFANYRETYRKQSWENAQGEQVLSISVRSGRRYDKVVIQRVTPAGLEIVHAEGRARIDATELDATWQQRFQWNEADRLALLDKERKNQDAINGPKPEPQTQEAPSEAELQQAEAETLRKVRAEYRAWTTKVNTLIAQRNEAVGHLGSENSSVPGELETWAARVNRLGSELSAAQHGRAAIRAKLELISPRDPLLRPFNQE